ncbi:MAG: M28 family peptidase, partial [Candidatus Nanopelagicales bacterium]
MPSDWFDNEEMFQWIRDQTSMGARRAGSAAGRQNEDYVEAHLREFGLEKVRREAIPITHWTAETHSVEIDAGSGFEPVDSFPIPYSAFTPPEGSEARLVFADPASLWHRADWHGAIVVTEISFPDLDVKLLRKFSLGQYDPDGSLDLVKHPATWVRLGWHLYHLAAKRGAVGFIGIVKDQPGGSCHMYAPYGFREKDILDKPIPGFWVGRADGSWLRAAAESDDGRARLRLTGIREPGTMHNIVGEIPGSSDETIVLTCHHDSPFASPVEDASGVAVVLALARHFAQHRGLKRRLVVVLTAGHFYGSLGTRTFIEEHREDVVRHTALEITIEHIALEA